MLALPTTRSLAKVWESQAHYWENLNGLMVSCWNGWHWGDQLMRIIATPKTHNTHQNQIRSFNAIFWHHHHRHHRHPFGVYCLCISIGRCVLNCVHRNTSNIAHSPVMKPDSIEHTSTQFSAGWLQSVDSILSLCLYLYTFIWMGWCSNVCDRQCINAIRHPMPIFESNAVWSIL